MTILFLYYNNGLILKAYKLEGLYFLDFSLLGYYKIYTCPDNDFAIELAKSLANKHFKDMILLKKLFEFEE